MKPILLTGVTTTLALAAMVATFGAHAQSSSTPKTYDASVSRGKYLIQVAGCNDCHTPGYGPKAGHVPQEQWLVGDALGMQGPWGTTYPTNLRLFFARMSRQEWIRYARTMEPRPPMPWFNVRAMSDADLSAVYAFVKTLGPAGNPAPAALPPGAAAPGPVVRWPG